MNHSTMIFLILCARVASAQNALPELAPFPLEIIRSSPDFTKQDGEALQKLFPMMLRAAEVAVPGSARLNTALVDLRRQDCDRDDACLAQLGRLAASLYAIYVQVDLDLDGMVVASGRVVRDDGKSVRGPKTVKEPRGARPFKEAAQVVLKQLLTELEVAGLSAIRPSEPVAPVTPPPAPVVQPPPLTITTTTRPLTALGVGGVAVGGAGLLLGGILFATAGTVRTEVSQGVTRVFNEDANKVQGVQSSQTAGVVLLAVGGGLVAAGVGVLVLGPKTTLTTLVPVNGGAVVMMSGRLP